MKSSDVEAAIAARGGPVDADRMERSARIAGEQVNWRGGRIPPRVAENFCPFREAEREIARDARDTVRSKRLHDALDSAMDGKFDKEMSRLLHKALDSLIGDAAEENPDADEEAHIPTEDSDSDDEEEVDDEEAEPEEQSMVVVAADRKVAMDTPRGKLCFCGGHLGGVAGYNGAHGFKVQ
jgi:hypothetical protein